MINETILPKGRIVSLKLLNELKRDIWKRVSRRFLLR